MNQRERGELDSHITGNNGEDDPALQETTQFKRGEEWADPRPVLRVKRLRPEARLPERATDGSACFDLRVCEPRSEPITMGGSVKAATFATGLAFEVPQGHVMLIFSRSGHGFKHDIRLANCVGVIDSDYRGEVGVRLTSDTHRELVVKDGDRIAQAMLLKLPDVVIEESDELSDTPRGTGGFGSTGS
jgi:dUTP pyrophosphatase